MKSNKSRPNSRDPSEQLSADFDRDFEFDFDVVTADALQPTIADLAPRALRQGSHCFTDLRDFDGIVARVGFLHVACIKLNNHGRDAGNGFRLSDDGASSHFDPALIGRVRAFAPLKQLDRFTEPDHRESPGSSN